MKLLNLCCGANRPLSDEWVNLDQLRATLLPGTPERFHLDAETNYVEHNVLTGALPFEDETFDGVLMSHCLEHWPCEEGAAVMMECRRVLKPGGVLLVSVPDASYFRKVHDEDTPENAVRLFGEPIHLPDGENTFTGYALWCPGRHKVILTEDALWHYFKRAGFNDPWRVLVSVERPSDAAMAIQFTFPVPVAEMDCAGVIEELTTCLNRLQFSLVMCAVKE